jgi:hypothetical protein
VRIPGILVVTGAAGSGKTTTVRALEARALSGVRCYYFDAIGVSPAEVLEREFGSPESWQAITTRAWLDRLAANPDGADVCVLDGQTRPSFVRSAVEHVHPTIVRIVLLGLRGFRPPCAACRTTRPARAFEPSNGLLGCVSPWASGRVGVTGHRHDEPRNRYCGR